MYKNQKAFTLIELLVVVLIIGILSAIALPQYQKAVHKARMAEISVRLKAMQNAADLYVLQNGYPASTIQIGDIDDDSVAGLTVITDGTTKNYRSKYVDYFGWCASTGCTIAGLYPMDGIFREALDGTEDVIEVSAQKNKTTNEWTRNCTNYSGKYGTSLCKSFK